MAHEVERDRLRFKNDKLDGKLSYYDEERLVMEYIYKDGEKISGGIIENAEEEPIEEATK